MAEVLSSFKILLPVLMAIFRSYVESRGIGTPGASILLPAIIWDPRNPLFNCPSRGINTINVRMSDYLNFACPLEGRNVEWHHTQTISYVNMYENGWFLTDETAARNCNASTKTGSPFINCNDPTKVTNPRKIRISKHAGVQGDPTFNEGTTYYLIGTGSGTQGTLGQKVGGRCSGYSDGTEVLYNLTLRIHVCSRADENTDRCPICLDSACYSKGCGLYGSWQAPMYHRNISSLWLNDIASTVIQDSTVQAENKCYRVRERVCDDASRGCTGPSREIKVVECPKVYVNSTGGCTDEWKTKPKIYRNETNGCYQINYRDCIVGTLERYNKTEWKMVNTICPTTLPPPTTPTPKKVCQTWRDVHGLYRNGSSSCFMLQERECQLCKTMPNITERQLTERNCPPPSTTVIPKPSPSSVEMSTLKRTCNESKSVVVKTVFVNSTVVKTSRLYIEKTLVVTASRSQSIKPCATTVMPCPSISQKPQTKTASPPTKLPTEASSTTSPKPTKDNRCGHPVVGQQKGEDQKSYVPYTVGACAFLVGVITGFLIMILLKKLKGDSPRISQDKYCTQNGYDTESNHTVDTVLSPGIDNKGYELDSLKRKSTIALTKPA